MKDERLAELNRVPDPAPGDGQARALDLGVLEDVLVFRLRRIRNHLTETFRSGSWRDGLRPGEFSTLALIVANPGISQIDLAREGGFDQPALVGIMDDLERRGWAERRKHREDRRRYSIAATDAGRAALDELLARALENEKEARAALSEEELRNFTLALDKMYHRLLDG